jgi:hypothetical protein
MPDLEEKIATWRRQMAAGGINTPAVLDELESHLREELRARLSAGDLEAQAFETAVAGIGSPQVVRSEFNKIIGPMCLPVKVGASIWIGAAALMVVWMVRRLFLGTLKPLLAAHIFDLTIGYLAVFLTGAFALYFVCLQWFGKMSPSLQQSLDRAVRGFSRISTGLVVAGLVLGIIWSKQNRGVYWGGNSREMGPLLVSVWLIAFWTIQHFGQRSVYARMLACVGGNVIVSLAWFGAQIVARDPGLSHYGSYWPLEVFVGVHVLVLAMGFSRRFEPVKT